MSEEFKIPILPVITNKVEEDSAADEKKQEKSEKFECPYKIPAWNGVKANRPYSFEVLKNGTIVEVIRNLHEKSYHVFGRLPIPNVDINSAHPTSSRFHCVLQYRPATVDDNDKTKRVEEGWYLYDLGKFNLFQ
jgi:hypothetical protein